MEEKTKFVCCFCGKEESGYGNDIRPLVNERGTRCCDKCNAEIVIPNREKFWFNNVATFYTIKNSEGYYYDSTGQPLLYNSEDDATKYIREHCSNSEVVVKLLTREDT